MIETLNLIAAGVAPLILALIGFVIKLTNKVSQLEKEVENLQQQATQNRVTFDLLFAKIDSMRDGISALHVQIAELNGYIKVIIKDKI